MYRYIVSPSSYNITQMEKKKETKIHFFCPIKRNWKIKIDFYRREGKKKEHVLKLHGRVGITESNVRRRRRCAADGSRPFGFDVPRSGDGSVVDAVAARNGRGQGALDACRMMVCRTDGSPFQGPSQEGFVTAEGEGGILTAAAAAVLDRFFRCFHLLAIGCIATTDDGPLASHNV